LWSDSKKIGHGGISAITMNRYRQRRTLNEKWQGKQTVFAPESRESLRSWKYADLQSTQEYLPAS
jgi:hypothetical protein